MARLLTPLTRTSLVAHLHRLAGAAPPEGPPGRRFFFEGHRPRQFECLALQKIHAGPSPARFGFAGLLRPHHDASLLPLQNKAAALGDTPQLGTLSEAFKLLQTPPQLTLRNEPDHTGHRQAQEQKPDRHGYTDFNEGETDSGPHALNHPRAPDAFPPPKSRHMRTPPRRLF